ncbi:MAG: D-alanyl-D-alanine carboxypeptidase/D-alanyl-D-alanine-endopeptidase [Thermoleophilia bacterium]|nr:D-alanyl-D-alanine carboxypeptidase/D-alanyl-D-alanine-endopeptidase [Thermoleophilia bacterium]
MTQHAPIVRVRLVVVALLSLLVAGTTALASAAPAHAGLDDRIGAAVQRSGVASTTSVYVWDQTSRRVLYSRAATRRATPASTMKLLTSAAAMARFGPDHRFRTKLALRGTQTGSTFVGDVWLIGGGDPSLSTYGFRRSNYGGSGTNIAALAGALKRRGITLVRGHMMVDDDLFDEVRYVPQWKPSFYYDETGALGALTVNQSQMGRWIGTRSTRKPDVYAGETLRTILKNQGVEITARTEPGSVPDDATVVAQVASPTLRELLAHMNSTSDNFYAETLIKQLGVERFGERGDGSTADGARAVRAALVDLGADMRGVSIVDGSGLAYGNRVTARAVGHVLGLGAQAEWGEAWIHTFAQSGRSGTLRHRMTRRPYYSRVYAKTGTLRHASALAGFAHRLGSNRRYGFVALTYDPRGRQINYYRAHSLQDRIAMILVR